MTDMKEQVNLVGRYFNEQGLNFDHVDQFDNPMIVVPFGGGDYSYTHMLVHLIFDEDGESGHILTSPIGNVPVEKTAKMLLELNEFNRKFRWVKFYLDDDNDVVADGDVLFDEQNAGAACFEMVMRTASIIDDAYPEIMRAIWSD